MTNRDHSPSISKNDGGDAKLRTEGSGRDLDALEAHVRELPPFEDATLAPSLVLRLIQTQRELVAALIACKPFIRRAAEGGEAADEAYASLRAVIAKAEGRS